MIVASALTLGIILLNLAMLWRSRAALLKALAGPRITTTPQPRPAPAVAPQLYTPPTVQVARPPLKLVA